MATPHFKYSSIFIVFSFFLFINTARADIFTAKDGSTLDANIIGGKITIKTGTQEQTIPATDIVYFKNGQVILSNGKILCGKISSGMIETSLKQTINAVNIYQFSGMKSNLVQHPDTDNATEELHKAVNLIDANNIKDAILITEEVLKNAEKEKSIYLQASALSFLSIFYLHDKQYSQSINAGEKAVQIIQIIQKEVLAGSILTEQLFTAAYATGMSYYMCTDFIEAVKYLSTAKNVNKLRDDDQYTERIINHIANSYHKMADYTKTLSCYQEGFDYFKSKNDLPAMANSLNQIGQIYFILGDLEKSKNTFAQEDKIRISLGQNVEPEKEYSKNGKKLISITYKGIGSGLFASINKVKPSRENFIFYYTALLTVAESTKYSFDNTMLYFARGKLYEQDKKYGEAIADYRKAVENIEIKRFVGSEEDRMQFFEQYVKVYHYLARLLIKTGQAKEAFEIVEKAKAKTLTELLRNKEIVYGNKIDPELLLREQELEADANKAYFQYAFQVEQIKNGTGNQKDLEQITNTLVKKEETFKAFQNEIRYKNSNYADLKSPGIISVDEIQKNILNEQTALLEYSVEENDLILFFITKKDIHTAIIPFSEESLARTIVDFRTPFVNPDSHYSVAKQLNSGNILYHNLIEPITQYCKNINKIIIIPDGPLYHLPFNALPAEKSSDYKKTSFLINAYTISFAPSATILNLLKQAHHDGQGKIIAFGDPEYGNKLPRLENTIKEVQAIESIFSPDTKIYTGKDATKKTAKEASNNAKILHFAAHGYLDEDKPMYSAIVLSPDDNDPMDDGFLYAREIFGLNLKADLVTLAACQTGLGKLRKGEGILSLARSFLYAGASSIIVSLWSVDDQSTTLIMEKFYSLLKEGNISKQEALRQAQLSLAKTIAQKDSYIPTRGIKIIKTDENITYDNPYFWAPFILIGE